MNFQIFKLVSEKAEEPEIKLPTSAGSLKKQESLRKHLFLIYWLFQSLWLWITINYGKFWKKWETDYLTCLLRNLYADQEAAVRTGHGTTDWFQIGKAVHQGCILSPSLFNFYAEYIMRNAGLEEVQAGIKIVGRGEQGQSCSAWQFEMSRFMSFIIFNVFYNAIENKTCSKTRRRKGLT